MQPEGHYASPSARQAEVAVVRAIYAAFARRDVEAALECLGRPRDRVGRIEGVVALTGERFDTSVIWVWRGTR